MNVFTLRASNGQYVCAEMGGDDIGTVNANRDRVGPWESFTMLPQPDGRVAIRTVNGRFFCAEGGGGGDLHANRTVIGPWEHFTVVPGEGSGIALQTDNGHFVCAENGGGGIVVANRTRVGPWETFNTPPPAPPNDLRPLHSSGHYFALPDGTPWRYKGVSSFKLMHRWVAGEDIGPVLMAYAGYNTLRVWPYVNPKDWGADAWDSPSPDQAVQFVQTMAGLGWRVEFTCLTDSDPARITQAKAFIAAFKAANLTSLFLEAANEPEVQHDGVKINTAALRPDLEASGYPYASGDYVDINGRWYGSYLTTHTKRDPEWVRRTHDGLDIYNGAPDDPASRPHHVPILFDEPAKLEDVWGDHVGDWLAYFGSGALFGAGVTFHSATGKLGLPPVGEEVQLAATGLSGLNQYPPDAPNGAYSRVDDNTLRTYIIGNAMVRMRPTTPNAPQPGWSECPVEPKHILWTR